MKEVQKYAEGRLIYIPKNEKTKGWGEASGYREKLNKRNAIICSRYAAGSGIMELAEEFYLSPESIKKIVYGRKINLPKYSPSVYSAKLFSDAGVGEEWVKIPLSPIENYSLKSDIAQKNSNKRLFSSAEKVTISL